MAFSLGNDRGQSILVITDDDKIGSTLVVKLGPEKHEKDGKRDIILMASDFVNADTSDHTMVFCSPAETVALIRHLLRLLGTTDRELAACFIQKEDYDRVMASTIGIDAAFQQTLRRALFRPKGK